MCGRARRLRTFGDPRIHRMEQQSRRWRQHFSLDQREWPLCDVPFLCDEFGGQRHQWCDGRVRPRHLRRGAVRLYAFHAARFRGDRRNAGQRRKHFGHDQRLGPLHHVRFRSDQPRRRLVFLSRNVLARYLRRCRHGLQTHNATAGLDRVEQASACLPFR